MNFRKLLLILVAPMLMAAADPTLAMLERQAVAREQAKARVALLPENAGVFQGIESLEEASSGRVPNYLRSFSTLPASVKPFAHLIRTFIYDGTLAPELKLAMALRIAQVNQSPYATAHLERLLGASERGKVLLGALRSSQLQTIEPMERIAIQYADTLTRRTSGLDNEEFQRARAFFNDSQVVELSFTTCFFNYFSRYVEALHLPVEEWVKNSKPAVPVRDTSGGAARIALISDEEMQATKELLASAQASALGIGIANSQRAMMRVPALGLAWRSYGFTAREAAAVGRDIKLQISFAVSKENGCRYCTLHQVLGLHKLGVSPAKLMSMAKDDSQLTPRELAAVSFARKVTTQPGSVTDADYEAIRKEFGEQGALEVLMQTCNFAFMNRFTDSLRLPSEDEAVKVYKEVYGSNWTRAKN